MRAFLYDINKLVKTTLNGFTRRGVVHFGGRRAFALRIDEREHLAIAHLAHKVCRRLEIFLSFAREAHDDVGRKRHVGVSRAYFAHEVAIVVGGIAAVHGLQHAIATRLNGKVQSGHEVGQLAE